MSQKPTRRLLLLFKKVKFEADVVKFSDFSNPYRKDWRHELEFKFDRSEFMDELNKITSITNSQIS